MLHRAIKVTDLAATGLGLNNIAATTTPRTLLSIHQKANSSSPVAATATATASEPAFRTYTTRRTTMVSWQISVHAVTSVSFVLFLDISIASTVEGGWSS